MEHADGCDQARSARGLAGRWAARRGPPARGSAHGARMDPSAVPRPVEEVVSGPGIQRQQWPAAAAAQAEALQRLLAIGDRDWHALKAQPCRRAAEQLAGALVQLLQADGPGAGLDSAARARAIALTTTALAWLEGDLRDPGCPQHGR